MSPIGIFGGTFDPIHYGHLRTAFEMLQALRFDQVRFVPNGDPPHRGEFFAPAALRLEMVQAATANEPNFVVADEAGALEEAEAIAHMMVLEARLATGRIDEQAVETALAKAG